MLSDIFILCRLLFLLWWLPSSLQRLHVRVRLENDGSMLNVFLFLAGLSGSPAQGLQGLSRIFKCMRKATGLLVLLVRSLQSAG